MSLEYEGIAHVTNKALEEDAGGQIHRGVARPELALRRHLMSPDTWFGHPGGRIAFNSLKRGNVWTSCPGGVLWHLLGCEKGNPDGRPEKRGRGKRS